MIWNLKSAHIYQKVADPCSILFSITRIRGRRDYDEQKADAVMQTSLPGLPKNAKCARKRKYLRG